MDDKFKGTIKRIVQLTQQNLEFGTELRKALGIEPSAISVSTQDKKIDEVYEYCIEKVLKEQAKDFYLDFPLKSILPTLINDFVRMESFRHKDNFEDFCLALYQQIERMTNLLCTNKELGTIAEKMWSCPAYVKYDKETPATIDNRVGTYTIASLVFPGTGKNGLYAVEKSKQNIQTLSAMDKTKVVLYFLGYKAAMRSNDYENFIKISQYLKDIYQCRNLNHRGNTLLSWEKEALNRILPLKSFHYCIYLGVLSQYVQYIKDGLKELPAILKYAESLEKQLLKPDGPKILGKIDLSKFEKKKSK